MICDPCKAAEHDGCTHRATCPCAHRARATACNVPKAHHHNCQCRMTGAVLEA